MDDDDRVGHETRLRTAVLAGDEAAWRAWYDAAAPGLRAYVHWRCPRMPELADEIVQETWLTAVRRVRAFRPDSGSFAAWLCGIAANVIRNRLRQRRSEQQFRHERSANASADRDAVDAVAWTLAQLLPRYEQALRDKYLDGLSVQAMAQKTGDSEKAVESLLTRARQAFREAYQAAELVDG